MSIRTEKVTRYTEALNNKDIEAAIDQMADSFCLNDPFVDGLQPKSAVAAMYRESLPEAPIKFLAESVVEDGDTVIVRLKTEFIGQLYRSVNVFTFDGDDMVQLDAFAHGLKEAAAALANE